MRTISFTSVAFNEYNEWFALNIDNFNRIQLLIRDINREPFKGLGKPEPLRGNWSGYWSRRIDNEHRQ